MPKGKNDAEKIHVGFEMEKELNEQLEMAAKRSGRTKRQEAKWRLQDHLNRFTDGFIDHKDD